MLGFGQKRCAPKIPLNSFSYRGSGGLGNTGLGPNRENSGKPRTTFVRRRGTWCMSPSPLCGESGRSRHFYRKTQWFQYIFLQKSFQDQIVSRSLPRAS